MNIIDATHDALQQIPSCVSSSSKTGMTTAYYTDVPTQAIPTSCTMVPIDGGYRVQGQVDDCLYSGQLITGSDPLRFRRAILSFTKVTQSSALH